MRPGLNNCSEYAEMSNEFIPFANVNYNPGNAANSCFP